MARIISIDYGSKRCGLATTDPLQIIVTALASVETPNLWQFLVNYMKLESVEKVVLGLPSHKDGNFTHLKPSIDALADKIKHDFPEMKIDFQDENFTSVEAKKIALDSGIRKKARQEKGLYDRISAVLILQKYLKHI